MNLGARVLGSGGMIKSGEELLRLQEENKQLKESLNTILDTLNGLLAQNIILDSDGDYLGLDSAAEGLHIAIKVVKENMPCK